MPSPYSPTGRVPAIRSRIQWNAMGFSYVRHQEDRCAPTSRTTPTEVILYVRRASPDAGKGRTVAPDPLADPLQDFNIQPGEATSYMVRKGEYIQILDVKGRECSDFQAFSLRALDKGLEREIDPTTTRSLMGMLYPTPGLFSKYWSVDHEPLVEIVQDTCGRHDTFGLACTARYYEDIGLSGSCQLLGQHQCGSGEARSSTSRRMASHQLLFQHHAG